MTGAEAAIETLQLHGVKYIFGYSGGAAIPFFDALETTETDIQLISARHEQGAAHMADGYARTSGQPGVLLVTSGPGVGNIVTGLMTAHMDSVPLIALCGQQVTSSLGYDAFQEADTINMTMPVVKHSFKARTTHELPKLISEAWHIATTGRPGPVVIDIPKDISAGSFSGKVTQSHTLDRPKSVSNKSVRAIIDAWRNARRPVILAGHGVLVANAKKDLVQLAEKTHTPVVTTLLAKGAIPEDHPLSLGMLGMHGTVVANRAIEQCDFLLNIGSRFDDRIVGKPSEFCKDAFIAHIDIDSSEIDKIIKTDIAIVTDAQLAIEKLIAAAAKNTWPEKEAVSLPLQPKGASNNDSAQSTHTELTMQHVIQKIDTIAAPSTIVTTDVGQHQMWAALNYKVDTQGAWLTSGGAGTMGYGFPAALGAQLAQPDSPVLAIVGDGGFQMTLAELATARAYDLPVKVIILNNHYLGMVRQWQELFYDNRESGVELPYNPDFCHLAQSYGITAISITNKQELAEKLTPALSTREPVIINIEVTRNENVYPMIPAGAPYSAMITAPPSTPLAKPTGST